MIAPQATGPLIDVIAGTITNHFITLRLFDGRWKKGGVPDLWGGQTDARIVERLERLLSLPSSA